MQAGRAAERGEIAEQGGGRAVIGEEAGQAEGAYLDAAVDVPRVRVEPAGFFLKGGGVDFLHE